MCPQANTDTHFCFKFVVFINLKVFLRLRKKERGCEKETERQRLTQRERGEKDKPTCWVFQHHAAGTVQVSMHVQITYHTRNKHFSISWQDVKILLLTNSGSADKQFICLHLCDTGCFKHRKKNRVGWRKRDWQKPMVAENSNSNSNLKTLFYKDCSLDSVKNLSNN